MKSLAVCVGDNCIDSYLPPFNRKFVGGNALNVAVHMQHAGCQAAYVGAVGEDREGQLMIRRLQVEGIDVSRVQVHAGNTATTTVLLTPDGERHFIHEDMGPKAQFKIDAPDLAFIRSHRLVHNTWLGGTEDYLAAFGCQDGPVVAMDYGERYEQSFLDATIGNVDWAFFSTAPEQEEAARELARQIFARGPQLVIVTMGSAGALAFDGDFTFQMAIPVEAVDTLGAGDTFIGTFLAQRMLGKSLPQSLELAARAAAHTCTYFGAFEHSELEPV